MFKTGQQVVCINDEFDPWVFDLYRALPKKNRIYTVRAVGVGRSNPYLRGQRRRGDQVERS